MKPKGGLTHPNYFSENFFLRVFKCPESIGDTPRLPIEHLKSLLGISRKVLGVFGIISKFLFNNSLWERSQVSGVGSFDRGDQGASFGILHMPIVYRYKVLIEVFVG